MLDKIKGGLFGVAIGDALGGTTEFMKEEHVMRVFGYLTEIVGSGVWNLKPGETTDDTAMTLAVADGILANPLNPIPCIGEEFLKWKDTNPKDIGITIQQAFDFYQYEQDWFLSAEKTHEYTGGKSAGNGSLMRCLPVALAFSELETIDKWSKLQSKMTHYDDLASEACQIYNRIAYDLLNGIELKSSLLSRTRRTIYENDLLQAPACLPSGFVVDTFQWVLHVLFTSESFEDVVQRLANKGEDSDTTAAIAGGLKGLEVGYANLPARYKEKLIEKERLESTANELYSLRIK